MTNYSYIVTMDEKQWTLDAASYDEAANEFAKQTFGKKCWAQRVTGSKNLSGFYQAYRDIDFTVATAVGSQFHIM